MSKATRIVTDLKTKWSLLKNDFIEHDLSVYDGFVTQINSYDFHIKSDPDLKSISARLISEARNGIPPESMIAVAFALVCETASRTLGLRPFDVQMLAGVALHKGKLVEMQTGEGKTLSAVAPAFLNTLSGKGVHILTFNDYLARRDAEWMGPAYRFLGLSVGYVNEGMTVEQRMEAYRSDITYVTAKEAGFDYLKDFLSEDPCKLIHRDFNYAIIDEADSILIDEARIPMVIAGEVPGATQGTLILADIARRFAKNVHYNTDEYGRNVYLTEEGATAAESDLGCGNLYADGNYRLLTGLNCALHAQVLLKRDIDYLVRGGKIELVDEFTGRVADRRHWPDGLQAALEAKENIAGDANGCILGSITVQDFVRLYPSKAGMTGTAVTSAEDFHNVYNMNTVVIQTNKPNIRLDRPDTVFTHKEAKVAAIVNEVIKANSTGRPVLIGTVNIVESEDLALCLKEKGIYCQVLNARNDEMEAAIIANAGMPGAVTVSTNMAGRGTDIRLGGEDEKYRDVVVSSGGLYVIGANRYESRRIDNQLRGRAGRQGDPGETGFFISLEDDLMVKYKLDEIIQTRYYPSRQEGPLENSLLVDDISRAQRIIEGQNSDIRATLRRYSLILEDQRKIIHKKRSEVLSGNTPQELLAKYCPDLYEKRVSEYGRRLIGTIERQITLSVINRCWSEHLGYIADIKESIHLVSIAAKSPLDEFNKMSIKAFEDLGGRMTEMIADIFTKAHIDRNGIDLEKEGLKGPSSTWTYLVDDKMETSILPILRSPVAAAFNPGLLLALGIYERFFKKHGERIK